VWWWKFAAKSKNGEVKEMPVIIDLPRRSKNETLTKVMELFKSETQLRAWEANDQDRLGRIYWIETGRTFDVQQVARMAGEYGLDTRRVLRAIHVIRPLNLAQMEVTLNEIARPVVWSGQKPVTYRPLIIIPNARALYGDNVARFNQTLRRLSERAVVWGDFQYQEESERRVVNAGW
jgi:hypothetical protein